MSGPDRLQEQLKRDPQFLQQYYLDSQMQLNARLQRHDVAMVNVKEFPKLAFYFSFTEKF